MACLTCMLPKKKLRSMIKTQERKQGDLRAPFSHFCRDRSGSFDLRSFSRGLKDLKIRLTQEEVENLFSFMDLSGNGKVNFAEFAVFVRDPEWHDLERRIRAMVITSAGSGGHGDFRRIFRDLDEDGSGTLEAHELQQALKTLGITVPRSDIARIVNRYDFEGLGGMRYADFVSFMESNDERGEKLLRVIDKVRRKLSRNAARLRSSFQRADRRGEGALDARALNECLADFGIKLNSKETSIIVDVFDNDGDGLVSYVELVDFIDDGDADEDDDRVEEVLYDLKKLVRDAEKRGVDYRASFEHFDTDYTGRLMQRDSERACASLVSMSMTPMLIDL